MGRKKANCKGPVYECFYCHEDGLGYDEVALHEDEWACRVCRTERTCVECPECFEWHEREGGMDAEDVPEEGIVCSDCKT
jgi:hypothetical protein